MKRDVFVDASAWIALLKANERVHPRALSYWRQLLEDRARLVTTSYVISESATRLRYDAGLPAALAFRERLRWAVSRGLLRIAWIDETVDAEGWQILAQHADVTLSLADATSAAVARRAKITEVFTFDGGFRSLGFDVQPVG